MIVDLESPLFTRQVVGCSGRTARLLLAAFVTLAVSCGPDGTSQSPDVDASREPASSDDDGPDNDDVGDDDDEASRDAASGRLDAGSAGATRDGGGSGRDGSSMAPDGGVAVSAVADASAIDDASQARIDGGRVDAGSAKPPGEMRSEKFVGNITTRGQVRAGFEMMWDQITPENEGKWGSVESVRDQMNWSALDRIHEFAKRTGVRFKQHTFVWGSQQPSWLGSLSRAEQAEEVEEWIRLFCERYPDVELIDVVNEPPPHTTPVYMQALGGAGASGHDWIVQAFKLARKHCPNATLILNDYNNIEYAADHSRFISIAKAVKQAGAPIDAVGAQAHDAYKLPANTVRQFLDRLANDTGLPVYITEYDLNIANDMQQRQVMEAQFPIFWQHPRVRGITLWGYISGTTWLPNTGLMSAAGAPRPALTWLLSYLESERARSTP
jgi:endo-1,4-beta-xylanase